RDGHLDGLCEIWVDFNNGTVIGMYKDVDYGYIGDTMEPVGNPEAYLPKGTVQKISDFIEFS
ncbi:MAG: hypothetical protein Q4G58_16690, partial [bacterium]|nr:hypothetical protein [bacterium]